MTTFAMGETTEVSDTDSFDGGFEKAGDETPFTGWGAINNGGAPIARDTDVKYAGAASLRLDFAANTNTAYNQVASFARIEVEPNTKYQVSYWAKRENYAGLQYIEFLDAGNTDPSFTAGLSSGDTNGWVLVSGEITTGPNTNELWMRVSALGVDKTTDATDGHVWFDNVRVIKVEFDGGFERLSSDSVFDAWINWNNTNATGVVEKEVVHSGKYALRYDIAATTSNQSVSSGYMSIDSEDNLLTVKENTTYRISYWTKKENVSSVATMLNVWKSDLTQCVKENVGTDWTGDTDWIKVSDQFTTGAGVTRIRLWAGIYSGAIQSGNGKVYIDDIQIEEIPANLTELLRSFDGGFEVSGGMGGNEANAFANWTAQPAGDNHIVRDTNVKYNGNSSVHFEQLNGGGEEYVETTYGKGAPVESGKPYTFSVKFKSENVSGIPFYFILIPTTDDGDWYVDNIRQFGADSCTITDLDNGWKLASVDYQDLKQQAGLKDCKKVVVRIAVSKTQASTDAKIWFDDAMFEIGRDIDTSFDASIERFSGGKFEGWERTFGTAEYTLDKDIKVEGEGSLKITRKAGVTESLVVQSVEALEVSPNTEYIISYSARQSGLKGDANQYIEILDAKGTLADPIVCTGATNEQWKTVYGRFTTGENTTKIYVQLSTAGTQGGDTDGTIWFDNIRLQPAPKGIGEYDGGFEVVLDKQPLNWTVGSGGNCFEADDSNVQEGTYSAKITKTTSQTIMVSANSLLPVTGGQYYEASYYIKGTNDTVMRYVMLTQLKEDGITEVEESAWIQVNIVQGEAKEWSRACTEFTAHPDAKYVRVTMVVANRISYESGKEHSLYDGKEAITWFDSIAVKEAQEDTFMIKNGGFERIGFNNSPLQWNTFGMLDGVNNTNDFIIQVVDNGYIGKGLSMTNKVSGGYSAAHPTNYISVKANQSYELTYWIKTENAQNCSSSVAINQFADDNGSTPTAKKNYLVYSYTYGNTDGWEKVTVTFTTEKDAKTLWVVPTFSGGTGTAIFDDMSLREVATLGPTDNLGFEYGEDTPRDWTFSAGSDTGEEIDLTKFSWHITKDAHSGKQALSVKSNSSSGYAQVTSSLIPVKRSTEYIVSYWVKLTGAKNAKVNVGFHMWSDTSTSGNATPEWQWYEKQYSATGSLGEWVKISLPLTTAADCDYIDIRFVVSGSGMEAILDDITITEVTNKMRSELNLSFEKGDSNWMVLNSGSQTPTVSTDNSHNGKQSLHIKKNNAGVETSVTSIGRYKVEEGTKLMFGGYYKSKNTLNSRIRINAIAYDKNGNATTIAGQYKPLNGSSVLSEWKQLVYTSTLPTGTVEVALQAMITGGQTEVYLDDFFYRIANISDEETLVDYSDFSGVTESGEIDGWRLQSSDKQAKFNVKTISGNSVGVLELTDGAEGAVVFETDRLISGKKYRIEADYNLSKEGNVTIKFYDYQGNHLEGLDIVQQLTANEDGNAEVTFTTPSCTMAEICFGGGGAGTYMVDDLDIILIDTADSSQSWLGKFVWMREDALTTAQFSTRYYLYHFNLEDDATYAPLQIVGDDKFAVWVNGVEVGNVLEESTYEWSITKCYDILPYLQKGDNVIAVQVYNHQSYAALIFESRITLANGSQVIAASDGSVLASQTAPEGWNQPGYDATAWDTVKVIGIPPISPWGAIYFDASLYAENKVEIVDIEFPEKIKAGTTIEVTGKFKIDEPLENDYPIEINIYRKNTTRQITSAIFEIVDGNTTSKWEVGKVNKVKMTIDIPDFLENAKYTLQLSEKYLYLTNEDVIEGKFMSISVIQPNNKVEIPTSSIEYENGSPTLYINGEVTAPVLYLGPGRDVWYNLQNEQKLQKADVELYVAGGDVSIGSPMNTADAVWVDENKIDYDLFDQGIYKVLSANPDAKIMLSISMFAPHWWLDKHPEEELRIQTYNYETGQAEEIEPDTRMASFSSELYKKESGEVLEKLIKHLCESSYASHVYAIKIQDGATAEFLVEGVTTNGGIPDFSEASLNAFRAYLKETYETNEALQKAWNDSKVTFDTATIPTVLERTSDDGLIFINPETNRKSIDYNAFMGSESSNRLLHYAQVVKEASDNKLLTGAYHGYLWNFNSESNGNVHVGIERVLESEYVDFICSPYTYGERDLGEAANYDAMIDGVQKHEKLYILEIDTRSVFDTPFNNADWDSDVGYCYTMEESVNSLKRDFSTVITKGAGLWIYNMYGTWWYDDQFMGVIREIKEEMYFSTYMERESTSDVAVYVDEMMHPYLAEVNPYGSLALLQDLLRQQRRNLAGMGSSYDLYSMTDLVDGTAGEYKINIMLSPFEITQEEKAAIESKLKKDDKIIIWIYLPGISNGSRMSEENVSKLTGMDTKLIYETGLMTAYFEENTKSKLLEGLEGVMYGNSVEMGGPLAYIDDKEATTLATATFGDGTMAALAMKDMGSWTSIYSTIPNLPSQFLRNLLEMTGQHIYSNNPSDIVYASSNYVAVHSMYGGEKTLKLDDNYAVYDVFGQEYVSLNTDTIEYSMTDGESKVFRLTEPNKITVLARTRGAHAEITPLGITSLTPGGDFKAKIKVDKGYYLEDVTVNGKSIGDSKTVELKDIQNSTSVVAVIRQEIAKETIQEASISWMLIIISIVTACFVVGFVIYLIIAYKKKVNKNKEINKGDGQL